MKILVCGGRAFTNYQLVHDTLLPYIDWDTTIIEGGANGADKCASIFASFYNVHHQQYKAEWSKYGKSAGYRRNIQMLEAGKPDLVIAFPGGKGTTNMVEIARKAGVKVIEINE